MEDIEEVSAVTALEDDYVKDVRRALLSWYDVNKRDFPWRRGSDAYARWVSEIMAQQTRIDVVIPYYEKWMERWPTVQDLAKASLDEVNSHWSGLGYYRRARFLLEGAKKVVNEYDGVIPDSVAELLRIPGIGLYTAGALASVAFGKRAPVVDGNVVRVLSRIRKIPLEAKDKKLHKISWALAERLVDDVRPGDFNEAIMELGATVCLPKKQPACSVCPLRAVCAAFKADPSKVGDYPSKSRPKSKVPECEIAVRALTRRNVAGGQECFITRRPPQGLLAGQWELLCEDTSTPTEPAMGATPLKASVEERLKKRLLDLGACPDCMKALHTKPGHSANVAHAFSHLKWNLEVRCWTMGGSACNGDCIRTGKDAAWAPVDNLATVGKEFSLTSSQVKALNLALAEDGSRGDVTAKKKAKKSEMQTS